MPRQTVSVELPEDLYQRVCETATAVARSVQDVVTASIAMSLPPLEKDLPPEIRADLGPMALLSAAELREISHESLAHDRQSRLEALAALQKKQPLSDAERAELDELVRQAQRVMLHRAEARRLLALRGRPIPTGLAADA
ncbi:MAG: hypothetical protein GY722_21215 [bacterium]|nr:hypothetical protein [bacterium]